MTSFESPALLATHEFLTARGWSPCEYAILDENGCPGSDYGWTYHPSFGGVEINRVDDATPSKLECSFDLDGAEMDFVIDSPGNDSVTGREACEEHAGQRWRVACTDPSGALDLAEVGALLDRLESEARAVDPRVFIECLFFGPCGRST